MAAALARGDRSDDAECIGWRRRDEDRSKGHCGKGDVVLESLGGILFGAWRTILLAHVISTRGGGVREGSGCAGGDQRVGEMRRPREELGRAVAFVDPIRRTTKQVAKRKTCVMS